MNHSPNQPSSAAGGIVSARAQPLPLVLAVTLAWLALGGSATQAGCRSHTGLRPVSPATSSGAPRAWRAEQPPSSTPDGALCLLEVPGYGPAVVWVPEPGSRRKPLLVAAHGAGGRPEYHCDYWRRIVGARGFVLCPRGRKTHFGVSDEYSAYYFPNHHWLRRALHASLTAVQTQYRKHLDATRAVYVGFSQGAIMGALTVAPEPTRFPRAVFIEGGGSEWNVPIASAYLRGGGKRVAFACGVKSCHLQAQRAVRYLRRAGVPARAAYVPGAGHTYGAALAPAVRSVFEWVVVGDPRWR